MIYSIKCKNFYSFADEYLLNFEVNDKAPNNNGYFITPNGKRLSKVGVVIGPNASGKTNLLKVLPFLKWLIIDSFNSNPNSSIPFKPFLFRQSVKTPTELGVTFELNNNIYIYEFTLNEERILKERLLLRSKTRERETNKMLFSRAWDDKNSIYIFSAGPFNLPFEFVGLLRSNASIVSTALRLNHKTSQEIGEYWNKIATNVVEAGWIGDKLLPNSNIDLFEALNFYGDNTEIKNKAEEILSRFDLGFNAFNIIKEKRDETISINVQVSHRFNNKEYLLPFQYESAGTKQLFVILKTILQVLLFGGVAVLDELDVNLHPEMIIALYDLIINPDTNPNNAQIIFSTHSHRILNELDKYQIFLVEKDKNGSSNTWRLDDVKGVRADDNYYMKYISGAYGATPKIN